MRIGEFGVKIEVEVGAVLDLLVAQTNGLPLLDEDATEERIEDGLHVLLKVLNQQNLTTRNTPKNKNQSFQKSNLLNND